MSVEIRLNPDFWPYAYTCFVNATAAASVAGSIHGLVIWFYHAMQRYIFDFEFIYIVCIVFVCNWFISVVGPVDSAQHVPTVHKRSVWRNQK